MTLLIRHLISLFPFVSVRAEEESMRHRVHALNAHLNCLSNIFKHRATFNQRTAYRPVIRAGMSTMSSGRGHGIKRGHRLKHDSIVNTIKRQPIDLLLLLCHVSQFIGLD